MLVEEERAGDGNMMVVRRGEGERDTRLEGDIGRIRGRSHAGRLASEREVWKTKWLSGLTYGCGTSQ